MTMTVAPFSIRVRNTPSSVRTSSGCRPMVGSSKTNTGVMSGPCPSRWPASAAVPRRRTGSAFPRPASGSQGPDPAALLSAVSTNFKSCTDGQRRVDVHVHELRQRAGPAVPFVPHGVWRRGCSGSHGTRCREFPHPGKNCTSRLTTPVPSQTGAAQRAWCCRRSRPPCSREPFGIGRAGKDLAQLVVDVGVGRDGGADVDARWALHR